jgi:lysozyme
MRPVPKAATDFVAAQEGLRLEAYQDPAGVLTIGYGHTGPEVHAGLRIARAQAEAWLAADLKTAAARLEAVVPRHAIEALDEAQYAAILSFVFNLGANPSWSIWKRLKAGRLDLVPAEMMRFVHVGRTRLPGLAVRRAAEAALWSSGETAEAMPPSSYVRAEATPPAPLAMKPLFRSRTAITGAAQLVGGASAGALAVQQTVAPYAHQAAVLGKLTAALAVFLAACGVVLLATKWFERREARR